MSRSQIRRGERATQTSGDDTGCHILHVDMDAFYASCELRARPELRGLPMIVGGEGSRGVVIAATYEARTFGIYSAMPMSRARRLCADLVVLPPTFELYAEVSAGVMAIFREVTPIIEPLSLDEAFLDISGAIRRLGRPILIAEGIRARVHDEQGITCSVGVASTKFIAKLASTRCKPDGLLVVPSHEVITFLHPLPVAALWGVGDKTEEALIRLGLRTVADVANTSVLTLQRALGASTGGHLAQLSWGRDPRQVQTGESEKSVGAEETFARDVDDPEVVRRELLRLSERVAARLRGAGWVSRTISIKVRFADFSTITRSRTLRSGTDVTQEVYATAAGLYEALGLQRARIRLVGVRAENLAQADTAPIQMLLDAPEHGWREADQAVDRATARFGRGAVRPARLVEVDPADSRGPRSAGPIPSPKGT